MVAAPNRESADSAAEQMVVFLPLGEAVLLKPECESMLWTKAADRVIQRARSFKAIFRDKIATRFFRG